MQHRRFVKVDEGDDYICMIIQYHHYQYVYRDVWKCDCWQDRVLKLTWHLFSHSSHVLEFQLSMHSMYGCEYSLWSHSCSSSHTCCCAYGIWARIWVIFTGILYMCMRACCCHTFVFRLRDTHDMPYNFSDVVLTQHDRPIFWRSWLTKDTNHWQVPW